jgi:light-regulated signal transduction histidine kinase (bacteriophytochrome)
MNLGGYLYKCFIYIWGITDNGIGFEEEYATKIFEVIQRFHG